MNNSRAFTLLELLVVVGIIAMLSSLVMMLPESDKRLAAVQGAAEELAATLRQARAMAMRRMAVIGVGFNIQNAPGTHGKILNNNTGGHWYRMIGPWDQYGAAGVVGPPHWDLGYQADQRCLSREIQMLDTCWIGERHVLEPNMVRFLAITDQDNGMALEWNSNTWGKYPATYPRPWFGWWKQSSGRLYAWGGYEPELGIVDVNGRPSSAFYFQGVDAPLVGCLNPEDRETTYYIASYPDAPQTVLLKAGTSRPLINAIWMDYWYAFMPDGTVEECWDNLPFHWRNRSHLDRSSGGGNHTIYGDIGDMGNAPSRGNPCIALTSYVRHTGYFAVTLAPDVDSGGIESFPTALDAYRSIMPAFRVMTGVNGDIRAVRVNPEKPPGYKGLDTTISDWQNVTTTKQYYRNMIATEFNQSNQLRGMPVSDWLTSDVLAARQWWMETD